jgi:subtilase family serine protease
MRIDREPTMRRAARRGSAAVPLSGRLPVLCLGALILALLFSSVASAARAKRACSASPPPGRAACMAMRLLIGPSSSSAAQPNAGLRAAGSSAAITNSKPFPGYLTPVRLHEAYALPNETAAGASQTIAVVDAFNDPTAEADLAVYDKQFGLAECTSENGCFKKVDQEGNTSPLPKNEGGWATEISIDVQMAHAICQNCHILLVETKSEEFSDLGTGVNTAAKAGATEISNSYGGTETGSYTSLNSTYFNHPGIVVAASSGDCGYYNKLCPEDTVGANFPADSPDVLAVGGTSLTESSGVWTSTVWQEGGSGCSTVFSAAPWQSEVGGFSAAGCGSGRAIADVAAIGDPNTGVDLYDSTPEEPGAPTGWGVWGGTSVAAPIVTSEFALAGGAFGVSYPASTIYSHAGEPEALLDVTAGTNGTCGTSTICKATSGFDGPTGLGSPIGLQAFAIAGTPQSVSPPTVTGVAEQGQTLTEHHGEWTGSPTSFSYQWERCDNTGNGCQTISGASATTYTLAAADIGSTVRVRETAHNSLGSGSADSAVIQTIVSNVPSIAGFNPTSGITGSTFTVTGTGFDTTNEVQLGKLTASFTVIAPTKLEVTIPDGAANGKLAVITAHGSTTSKAKFTVTLAIKSFKASGKGTEVTIKGTGFNSSSTVAFGGVQAASVTVSSKSKIKATVPAGAMAGPITVTNTVAPVGTVSSAASFTP